MSRWRKAGRAWLVLCVALAIHVSDEALTGFLAIYNPTVMVLRGKLPWLPLPVFRFEMWLTGLIVATVVLFLLSTFLFRGAAWMRPLGYAFAAIMLANALGHMAGTAFGRTVASIRFSGPMPGFYSSPLLLAASLHLMWQLRSTKRGERHGLSYDSKDGGAQGGATP